MLKTNLKYLARGLVLSGALFIGSLVLSGESHALSLVNDVKIDSKSTLKATANLDHSLESELQVSTAAELRTSTKADLFAEADTTVGFVIKAALGIASSNQAESKTHAKVDTAIQAKANAKVANSDVETAVDIVTAPALAIESNSQAKSEAQVSMEVSSLSNTIANTIINTETVTNVCPYVVEAPINAKLATALNVEEAAAAEMDTSKDTSLDAEANTKADTAAGAEVKSDINFDTNAEVTLDVDATLAVK